MIEYLTGKETNNIKACIFDLDGTLADTVESIGFSCNEALASVGFKTLPIEDYKYYAGDGARILVERAMKAAGAQNLDKLDEIFEVYSGFFKKDCTYKVTVYDGIIPLLRELKKREIKIAVLSNKPHERTLDVVDKLFGIESFDVVQGQTEEICKKPAPDGALMITKKLCVAPQQCLYIGDTNVDMQTGTAAGMYTVGVLWGFRDRTELLENGADVIIEHPMEILEAGHLV